MYTFPVLFPSSGLAPLLRKVVHWGKFAWEFLESVMISATQQLNRLSKDYRYVACCLSQEKKRLKVHLNKYVVASGKKPFEN